MKTNLLILLLLLINSVCGFSQITTPVVKANFGVDADLRANYVNGLVAAGNDDWFNNGTAGTGQFIIDTTGAAAILAGYTSNPATRMSSFARVMKQTPYSIVNNRLLLDAVFIRDYHGDDSTVFASGSNKNGMSPVDWSCPVSQGIPDKNDILDVFAHARRAGPNITDSLWLFGGLSIDNITGNRYFDFELYQTDFYYDRPTRTFKNYGPDAGHTAWIFNPDGSVNRPGDIIFTAEYSSASLTLVEARIWINNASLSMTPMFFNWGGLFDGATAGATYGYASIIPKAAGAYYTGLQCSNGTWTGPFSAVLQDNSVVTTYLARQFVEFSVNMTKLGLDPAYISTNGCGTPFRRVVVKTRASTSFSAELKDFVAPFRMFNYLPAQAVADVPLFCGFMGVSDISVINPMSSSTYTWATTNGHIVGTTTGPTIRADTTGNYIVTQQLHTQCPAYAKDTVTITFDATCVVLNKNLIDFSAVLNGKNVGLNWQVLQNEQIQSFRVEYSTDNNYFDLAGIVESTDENGKITYTLNHDVNSIQSKVIYYRILLTGNDGRKSYSQVVAIKTVSDNKENLSIYPNPSYGETWASFSLSQNSAAEYRITDVTGRIISKKKINLVKGNNSFNLSEIKNAGPGVYFLNLVVNGLQYTNKFVINR